MSTATILSATTASSSSSGPRSADRSGARRPAAGRWPVLIMSSRRPASARADGPRCSPAGSGRRLPPDHGG